MNDAYNEAPEPVMGVGDYYAMFRRHRKLFLQVSGAALGLLLLMVLLWPPTYRSSATILIESQEIPQDFVRSTITSFAAEQIEVIRQRTMTMQNIMDIVDRFGLYEEGFGTKLRSEKAEKFREDVKLDLMSAEVMDPRVGRPMEATIAFTLGFDHENPAVAQKVINEIVNLYLNENLRQRTSRSESTTSFLKAEAETINKELQNIEARIASFKQQYAQNLPEVYQFNLSVVERTEREIDEIDARIRALDGEKLEYRAKLAQLSPYAPKVGADGRAVMGDADRLKAAESEYREKAAVYSADHPTLARLKREIQSLRASLGVSAGGDELDSQLREAREQLHIMEAKYKPDHPQIAKQKRLINRLESQWAAQSSTPRNAGNANADNPAYLMVDSQLKSAEMEQVRLQEKRSELTEKLARFEMLMAEAPGVEQAYKQLVREHESAAIKYQDIKVKLREAEISKSLETERKGERFTVIEPPQLPEEPRSPNRPLFSVVSVVLSVMLGVLVIGIREAMDHTVRGELLLKELLGAAPLAVLPYLPSEGEVGRKSRAPKILLAGAVAAAIVVLVLFHFLVKPLDVTWFILLRRLGLQ